MSTIAHSNTKTSCETSGQLTVQCVSKSSRAVARTMLSRAMVFSWFPTREKTWRKKPQQARRKAAKTRALTRIATTTDRDSPLLASLLL